MKTPLEEWKEKNPHLSRDCHETSHKWMQIVSNYIRRVNDEIHEKEDDLLEGGFTLQEFLDTHGHRMNHLIGITNTLGQLAP
jgi:hypothetical protein